MTLCLREVPGHLKNPGNSPHAQSHRREQVSSTVAPPPLVWGDWVMLYAVSQSRQCDCTPVPTTWNCGVRPSYARNNRAVPDAEPCSVFLPSTFRSYSHTFTNTKLSSSSNSNANSAITLIIATCLLFPMDQAIFLTHVVLLLAIIKILSLQMREAKCGSGTLADSLP